MVTAIDKYVEHVNDSEELNANKNSCGMLMDKDISCITVFLRMTIFKYYSESIKK